MSLEDAVTANTRDDSTVKHSSLHLVNNSKYVFDRPKIGLCAPSVRARTDAMWAGVHAAIGGLVYVSGLNASKSLDEHAWIIPAACATYFASKAVYKTLKK